VTCRDVIADSFRDAVFEECMTQAARFLFGVAFGRREGRDVERKIAGCCEIADEHFVFVGFRASEFVVDVQNCGGASEFVKRGQEENGVRATGNSDSNWAFGLTGGEPGGYLIDHILILRAIRSSAA
jgi:hypothetical protein